MSGAWEGYRNGAHGRYPVGKRHNCMSARIRRWDNERRTATKDLDTIASILL